MKTFQKALAMLLVVIMLFSMANIGIVASAETEPVVESLSFEPITIVAGTNGYFTTTEENERYFHYNWDDALDYTITLQGGEVINAGDDYVEIEGNSYWLIHEDNQYLTHWFAGNTYKIDVELLGCKGTVEVTIVENFLEDITIEPIELIENGNGNTEVDENGEEFFNYYWWNELKGTVLFDGSDESQTFNGCGFDYNNEYYGFEINDSQYYEHWELGGTYTVTVCIVGRVIEVPVTIVESPLASIQVNPSSIVMQEGSNGSWNTDENGEWYNYAWQSKVNCIVIMKDGTVINCNGYGFDYNGEWHSFSTSDTQWEEHWTVGNTYTATVSLMGQTANVSVSITESPIKSITVEPISIVENTNGYLEYPGTEDEFYYYWWHNQLQYTITIAGEEEPITGTGTGFDYNGEWYGFSTSDNQWEEHWTAGNTYTATVSLMGQTANVSVSITESPIKSITVEPISIVGNTNGYLEYPGTEDEFYYYWWHNQLQYTVTIAGEEEPITGTGTGFDYNGEWYSFSTSDTQWEEHWTVGNTYTATVSLMGQTANVSVSITEPPIASIQVNPSSVAMEEYNNGDWNGDENGEWYRYSWESQINCIVTMNDGTVINCNGYGFNYKGEWYGFSTSDNQWEEHWYGGNTYEATVSCMGKSASVSISIMQKNTANGFEYIVQDGCAIINGCYDTQSVLTIPSTLGGYTVIGITDLTSGLYSACELVIPDTVTMLSGSVFSSGYELQKITLGKGVSNITNEMFDNNNNLKEIIVSEDNANYISVDGVLYDKDITKIIAFPLGKTGTYTVPDTVTDIDVIFKNLGRYKVTVDLGNSNTGYKLVDGVYYNEDMTVVYRCVSDATGTYTMPDTVETIMDSAFSNCNFSEIIISENVTEIVYSAFSYSMELERVVLPEKLESVGDYAFDSCESLSDIDLPSNLTSIGDRAFAKTGITSVSIPASVNTIGVGAYKQSKLASITLAEGIEEINSAAFCDTMLTNVVLPDSLTYLGSSAFEATPLSSVTFGSGLTEICEHTFCDTALTTVTLPENIEYIGYSAFAGSKIKNVIFENEAINIGEAAFYGCPIEKLDIKDGTVEIGQFAFYGSSITTLNLPDSVTDITYASFAESKNLLTIDVSDNLESLCSTAFEGTAWYEAQSDGVVYLENYLYGYKGEMPENTVVTVKDGTKLIADYAFYNQLNLNSIIVPQGVKRIGNRAFINCENLTSVLLPVSITDIEAYAFYNCYNITDVYYAGSEADRENMNINDWGNDGLFNATWHYNYVADEVCADGHTEGEWTVIQAATAEHSGLAAQYCTVCGELLSEDEIPYLTASAVNVTVGNGIKTVEVVLNKDYIDTVGNFGVSFEVNGLKTTVTEYTENGLNAVFSYTADQNVKINIQLEGNTNKGNLCTSDTVVCNLSRFADTEGAKYAQYIEFEHGDTNDDGVTNVKDLVRLKKIIAEIENVTDGADISGNGDVTITDLVRLAQLISAGKNGIQVHTVTFADFDGTVLEVITVPTGFAATPTVTPTIENGVFTGWSAPYNDVTQDLFIFAEYGLAS